MERTAIISVDGHVRASREALPGLRREAVPRPSSTSGSGHRRRTGARRGGRPARARRRVAVGLRPPPEGHGEPGCRGRGAVPQRRCPSRRLPASDVGTSAVPSSTGRPGWPTTGGSPTSARRRRAAGPARRSSPSTTSSQAVRGRPLGPRARTGRHHDAGPAARRHLLLRPRPRPGVGRLRRRRPADQPARWLRCARPTVHPVSPPS